MENLVIKAGATAKWDVKIGGEPTPTVSWAKGDKALETTGTLSIEGKKGHNTILTIKNAVRADCGKFSLTVKNRIGDDTATGELTVLGKKLHCNAVLEFHHSV